MAFPIMMEIKRLKIIKIWIILKRLRLHSDRNIQAKQKIMKRLTPQLKIFKSTAVQIKYNPIYIKTTFWKKA